MDEIDITVTPAERRAIARLFRTQQAQAAEVARHAAHALHALDARDDDPSPWGRTLLIAAFEALYEAESTRVRHMQEGLDAFDLDVDDAPAQSTDVDAPSPARPVRERGNNGRTRREHGARATAAPHQAETDA